MFRSVLKQVPVRISTSEVLASRVAIDDMTLCRQHVLLSIYFIKAVMSHWVNCLTVVYLYTVQYHMELMRHIELASISSSWKRNRYKSTNI